MKVTPYVLNPLRSLLITTSLSFNLMARTLDDVADRITTFTTAWKQVAPDAILAGMTLDQFIAATDPSYVKRSEIKDLMALLSGKRGERNAVDQTSIKRMNLVVNAVRGDLEFGPDSPFYRSLGYVMESERKSGRVSKKRPPAP